LFVYIDDNGEPWVARMLRALDMPVKNIALADALDEDDCNHENHEHNEDSHYWLDIDNAVMMLSWLFKQMEDVDGDNAVAYFTNKTTYQQRLMDLDQAFYIALADARFDTLVFGNHYAAAHFCQRNGLKAITVYDSCEDEAEPSAQALFAAKQAILDNGYPVVFGEENNENRVAHTLAAETGADVLIFHAAHNIGAQELRDGVTFADIMEANYNNVKTALGIQWLR